MAGEFQNLGVALKTVYPSKALEPMINEEAPFREKLAKSVPAGAKVSSGEVKFNGVLALPQNVAQIIDGEELQDAAERSEVQFTLKPTIFTATMQVSWLTRKAANDQKSAFNGGEVRRRTEETVSNLAKFIESTYAGTAGNGVRGYVESSSASGLIIKNPHGVKLLRQGMKVSVRTAADITVAQTGLDAVRITQVNPATRLVKTAGTNANGVVNDTVVVVQKASITSNISTTFANGIRNLIDDGTVGAASIHGVNRTTAGNEKLKSVINSNSGTLRDLEERLLIRVVNEVREGSGKRVTDLWTGPGQIEKYIEFVAPDRRRAVQGGSYDKSTGYKSTDELVHYAPGVALKFNMSYDILPREIFLFNWDTFFHYVAQETQWVDDDSLLHLQVASTGHKASWLAYMASMENIGCDMPCANAVIRDLKDPTIGD
jgi:hypothetical protein